MSNQQTLPDSHFIALYLFGYSIADVAAMCGCCQYRADKILRRAGVIRTRSKSVMLVRKYRSIRGQKAVNAWDSWEDWYLKTLYIIYGKNRTEISESLWKINQKLGKPYRSPAAVMNHLNVIGARKCIPKTPAHKLSAAALDFLRGKPLKQAAEDNNVPIGSIWRYVEKHRKEGFKHG